MFKKKRRTHMITVRLSEEEYFALREVSASDGIRSMSEITRNAVNTILPSGRKQENESEHCMDELRANIKVLETRLERIEAMLPGVDGELAIKK
jgi:predicted metal-binding transcription factor (methanogenesis marker protein 9)